MKFKEFTCTFYKNNCEEYQGIFKNKSKNDNKISFMMLDYETIIDIEERNLLRENEKYIFFLDIKNKKCKLELKKEEITFDVLVEEANMELINNKIIIEYFIETDEARKKIIIKESEKI